MKPKAKLYIYTGIIALVINSLFFGINNLLGFHDTITGLRVWAYFLVMFAELWALFSLLVLVYALWTGKLTDEERKKKV